MVHKLCGAEISVSVNLVDWSCKNSHMSLVLAPTVARGSAPLLQPFYYASSLFVEPMREDIASLLSTFAAAYSKDSIEPNKPFQLFKTIWKSEGWDLVHLKTLDSRARVIFLRTVVRLLVERIDPAEHMLVRLGALFALYTFYMIQPDHPSTGVQPLESITMPIDTYEQLLAFPGTLQPSLRSYATYILSQLLTLEVFSILPDSSFGAQNPRSLPHTMPLLIRDIDQGPKKKTGRPSQLEQSLRVEQSLSALERFLDSANTPRIQEGPASNTLNEYLVLKAQYRDIVSREELNSAEIQTMARIHEAERHVKDRSLPLGEQDGLERLLKAMKEPHGLLGLVHDDDMA